MVLLHIQHLLANAGLGFSPPSLLWMNTFPVNGETCVLRKGTSPPVWLQGLTRSQFTGLCHNICDAEEVPLQVCTNSSGCWLCLHREIQRARSSVFWFKHLSPKTPSSEVEQCLSDELQEFSKAAAERNDWSKIEFLLQIKAFSSGIKFKKPNVFYRSTSWLGCAYSLSPQISFPWQSPLKVLGFISLSMGLYKKLQFYATEFGCSCLYHDGICFIQLLVPENCSLCKYQNAKIKGW